MKILTSIAEFRAYRKALGDDIGFVPSLGGLHAGHVSLIEKSIKNNKTTIVSLFLNPTQFNQSKDLGSYPVNHEKDLEICRSLGVDAIFSPSGDAMYPLDNRFELKESEISTHLCARGRPGHFEGVMTVVLKLLLLIKPTRAYFGEKDYQQFFLISQMAQSFLLDTEIVPLPTVREESGLAMSTRNLRLSAEGRQRASLIFETISSGLSIEKMKNKLSELKIEVEYLEEKWGRIFIAALIEGVRLIDNVKK